MKIIIFAAFIAGISAAVPNNVAQKVESRLVTDAISSVIEDLSQNIRDLGLDPLVIEKVEPRYALPVPTILTASAILENIFSNGLSNIVINNLNYSVLFFRLNFDISLPHIDAFIGTANAHVSTFGYDLEGKISGNLAIKNIRVVGVVRVSVGIISGISINSLDLDFTLGGVDSDVSVEVVGYNVSPIVNNILSDIIPRAIADYRRDINELLEIIVLDIINDFL